MKITSNINGMNVNVDSNFKKFLDLIGGQKEPGLIIVEGREELSDVIASLMSLGFEQALNVKEAFELDKIYIIANQNTDKDLRDFINQYPTGQVEIFDKGLMTSNVLIPEYDNRSVVILTKKEELKNLQKSGFNLLDFSGPVYQ